MLSNRYRSVTQCSKTCLLLKTPHTCNCTRKTSGSMPALQNYSMAISLCGTTNTVSCSYRKAYAMLATGLRATHNVVTDKIQDTVPLDPDNYPAIKYWWKHEHRKEQNRHEEFKAGREPRHRGRKPKSECDDENVNFWHFQHDDSTKMGGEDLGKVQAKTKRIWRTLCDKYRPIGSPWLTVSPKNHSNSISRSRPNSLSFDYAKITTKLSPLPSPITPIGTTFNTPPTPIPMQSHPNPGSALGQQVPRSPIRFDLRRGHTAYKNQTKSWARNLTTRTRILTRRPSLMLPATTMMTLIIMISPSPLHGTFR